MDFETLTIGNVGDGGKETIGNLFNHFDFVVITLVFSWYYFLSFFEPMGTVPEEHWKRETWSGFVAALLPLPFYFCLFVLPFGLGYPSHFEVRF